MKRCKSFVLDTAVDSKGLAPYKHVHICPFHQIWRIVCGFLTRRPTSILSVQVSLIVPFAVATTRITRRYLDIEGRSIHFFGIFLALALDHAMRTLLVCPGHDLIGLPRLALLEVSPPTHSRHAA